MKLSEVPDTPAAAPAPAAPPRRLRLSEVPDTPAAPPQPPPQSEGFFGRIWRGMLGQDVSRAGRFGMGIADPIYGMAQMGARMPIGGEFDFSGATPLKDKVEPIVQAREQSYGQKEREAGLSGGLSSEWARMLGNVASPTNLALAAAGGPVGAGTGAAGRIALGAGIGAASALTNPVASETPGEEVSFGTGKLKQGASGAIGGAIGGAAGELVGSTLARALAGDSPQALETAMSGIYRTAMNPSRIGQKSAVQLNAKDRSIVSAFDVLAENKGTLQFPDASGRIVTGRLPTTLRELDDAINWQKRKLFAEYDAKAAAAAETETATPNPMIAPRFSERQAAEAQAARDVTRAQQAVTLAAAKQSRAGDNVYMTSAANQQRRAADEALRRAQENLARLRSRKETTKTQMYTPYVDLRPAARLLRRQARSSAIRDFSPAIAADAERFADNLETRGFYSLTEAQDVIQHINEMMKPFWSNPTHEGVTRNAMLAPVAQMLRESLDDAVSKLTGPGYQALRLKYGALREVEKDVSAAAVREGNKMTGGVLGQLAHLGAAKDLVKGVLSGDPMALINAASIQAARMYNRYMNSPNRAIGRLFAHAERRRLRPPAPAAVAGGNAARQLAPMIGGVEGAAALEYPWQPQN